MSAFFFWCFGSLFAFFCGAFFLFFREFSFSGFEFFLFGFFFAFLSLFEFFESFFFAFESFCAFFGAVPSDDKEYNTNDECYDDDAECNACSGVAFEECWGSEFDAECGFVDDAVLELHGDREGICVFGYVRGREYECELCCLAGSECGGAWFGADPVQIGGECVGCGFLSGVFEWYLDGALFVVGADCGCGCEEFGDAGVLELES